MADYTELFPPEGIDDDTREDVAKKVFDILDEILKDKRNLGLIKKWGRNYELVRGKHWKQKSTIPLVSANLVYRHQQQTVNQLTDNNPTFNISKVGDPESTDQQVYEDLQRAATHWWTDQEQQDILESSVRNGETYGICIEKVVFNADLEYGMGEVETIIVDPFYFGFYPVTLRDPRELQKAEAVFYFYPISVREAKRRWPDSADKIKTDTELLKELEDERRDVNSETVAKPRSMMTSLASVAKEILNWTTGTSEDAEETLVVEVFCRDYTMVKTQTIVVSMVNDMPVETLVEEEEPKYPGNIRYIVACNGKITLEDRKNPNINFDVLPDEEARKTYLYDKYPFCAVNSVRDTSSAWGVSDIEQLEWLNMEMDKALSQLVLEKDRAVRRKYINPKNSGVPNDHFTNFVSILNPVNEKVGAGIRVLDYPAIPVDVQNAITLFKDLFFLVSATFEVDQAQMGSNQLAYKSIAALIERVATMMRGKIRAYGRLVRERGRMYLSHVQNFYTEDRWITFEDSNGIQTAGKINGTKLIVPAKLTVVTGSTLPTSKVQQREEALALFQMQAIDRQELLSSLEWSGRADVIKRMAQGPVGAVMANLQAIGIPPELLQFFSQIASMDPKDIQKEMQAGQIPSFADIMQTLLAQTKGPVAPEIPPTDQAEIAVKQAEAGVKQAEARKIMAEIDQVAAEKIFTIEQTNTEKVKQQVALAGITFDEQKLQMEKARTVTEITAAAKAARTAVIPPAKTAKPKTVKRPKISGSTPEKSSMTAAPPPSPVPEATAKPAGFNEVGMTSDNIDNTGGQ
jgi:hypothetical protein